VTPVTEPAAKPATAPAAASVTTEPAAVDMGCDQTEKNKSESPAKIKRKKQKVVWSRMWYSNQFMEFKAPFITKKWSAACNNYIFGSQLHVDQSIAFKIVEVEEEGLASAGDAAGVIYMGFTTKCLLLIDMSELPLDPCDLKHQKDWFLTGNLFKTVGAFDGLMFTRTQDTIRLSIESGERIDMFTSLDQGCCLFPFIYMSGCVKRLQVV
jgi:hypothetical protein